MLLPVFPSKEIHKPEQAAVVNPEKEIKQLSNPLPHRVVSKRMPGKEAFAIPSIVSALKDKISDDAEDIKLSSNGQSSPVIEELTPFSQDQLIKVWESFVEKIEAPQLKSALNSRAPKLKENWGILYILDNELQNQRITLELKPQLISFLRKSLGNQNIEIEFTVMDVPDNQIALPYTEAEKWQSLAVKYPALNSLKSRFGLDFQ